MADEIRYGMQLRVRNGSFKVNFQANGRTAQAVLGAQEGIVTVGTSEEDMPIGDVATVGILVVQNLDAANYITWGPKSAGVMVPCGRLNAGEVDKFRLEPGVTLRWIANTASVKVEMHLLNN